MSRLDLAVVGGGVAGTFVAERMSRLRPEWAIALFERSDRVGGRLLSLWAEGIEAVRAELGGMRFRTSQPLVASLVDELGLATRPFRTVNPDNQYVLRGERLTASEFSTWDGAPYSLEDRYRRLTPGHVLFGAIDTVVPGALAMSDADWRAAKAGLAFLGRALSAWAIDELLDAVVGPDGRRFIEEGFGYESIFGDRNAADCIPWLVIEARPEDENQTLVDGMEALPRALAARFVDRGGVLILSRQLTGLRRKSAGTGEAFDLTFADGSMAEARRVVLALPQRSLADIEGPFAHREVHRLLDAVDVRAAAKLSLWYESPWWRASVGSGLRVVTDGPLQKVYLFDLAMPPQAGGALLLAYMDGRAREHWAGHRNAGVRQDDLPLSSPERWCAYAASSALVTDATQELTKLLGAAAPPPRAAAFKDWGAPGEHGAYGVWRVDRPSWELIPRLLQPTPGQALYVCGESFSESQGWVEGALETSRAVVDRLLD
jgi:monoamine oxidase